MENEEPVGRFIKFLPMFGHRGHEMFEAVTKTLKILYLDISKCYGQSCDNAVNMAGVYSTLQTRILEVCPLASFITCEGYSLNLMSMHAVC